MLYRCLDLHPDIQIAPARIVDDLRLVQNGSIRQVTNRRNLSQRIDVLHVPLSLRGIPGRLP